MVVHSAVDGSRVTGINVRIRSNEQELESITDPEGVAAFSFNDGDSNEIEIKIDQPGWDRVQASRSINRSQTTILHVKLFKSVQVEVQKSDSSAPAFGAMVGYRSSEHDSLEFSSCDANGRTNLIKKTGQLLAFIPHQSTCGGHHHQGKINHPIENNHCYNDF